MGLYYNGKKVRNLYYNGKCITRLALGKEMTRLVEGDDYERHKWLHFDSNGSANAEFISLPINSSVFDFTRKFIKYDNNSYFWTGSATFSYSCSQNIINVYNFENNTYVYVSNSSLASVNGIVAINSSASSLTFNEEQVPQYDFPIGSIKWRVSSVSDGAIFDTSSITVDGVERYIPVRLLRPIPATLDGNGIARNADECGMYDAVSGKFYGNVASSGTFTVEPSLVEGVDYEMHKWLVGDGRAYIDTLITELKGTISVDIDRTAVASNSNIFGREAYPGLGYESRCVVNLLNNNIADIYGIRTTYGYGVHIDSVDTLYLDLDTKIASTKSGNSTSIDIGTDIGGYNMLLFAKNNGSAPSYCWRGGIGKFKMADIISLTPVRLLRPIPAYLDANNKARAQYECGMLDLKTMKFYGNMNTSGKFTVTND